MNGAGRVKKLILAYLTVRSTLSALRIKKLLQFLSKDFFSRKCYVASGFLLKLGSWSPLKLSIYVHSFKMKYAIINVLFFIFLLLLYLWYLYDLWRHISNYLKKEDLIFLYIETLFLAL